MKGKMPQYLCSCFKLVLCLLELMYLEVILPVYYLAAALTADGCGIIEGGTIKESNG